MNEVSIISEVKAMQQCQSIMSVTKRLAVHLPCLLPCLLAAATACAATPALQAEEPQIMISLRVLQLKSERVGNGAGVQVPILRDLPLLEGASTDAVRVSVAEKEIDRLVKDEAAHCISAPRLFVQSGRSASVQIGREVAAESMQPTEEPGVFRLVQGEAKFEGMRFEVLAGSGGDGRVELRKLVMRFDQMVGREKVEGTSLEVGVPIMKSRESTHALSLKAGQRALLSTAALDGSDETLLVVVEAAVVGPPGGESKPYPKGVDTR